VDFLRRADAAIIAVAHNQLDVHIPNGFPIWGPWQTQVWQQWFWDFVHAC
jgi:hypothetical protein